MSELNVEAFLAENMPAPRPATAGTAVPLDPQVAFVVAELRQVLNGDIDKLRVMLAITQAVIIAHRLQVPGAVKKNIVSQALRFLVDNSSMSADDKLASVLLLDLGMSQAIDDLVFMATVKLKNGNMFACCFSAPVESQAPPAQSPTH